MTGEEIVQDLIEVAKEDVQVEEWRNWNNSSESYKAV